MVTGLILSGGMGRRVGQQDKGLLLYQNQPIISHVLARFAPQVQSVMISANRNIEAYKRLGAPYQASIYVDELPGDVASYPGPLGGILTGLQHCSSPYLAVVPCDVPYLPVNLVDSLLTAILQTGRLAALATMVGRRQPALCMLNCQVLEHLTESLRCGQRKLNAYLAYWEAVEVPFNADPDAFRNFNTLNQFTT